MPKIIYELPCGQGFHRLPREARAPYLRGSGMNALQFTQTRRGDVLIVAVTGEVSIMTAPAFQKKLVHVVAAGEKKVVLDMAETSYITSSGLGAILEAAKELRKKGGDLCLARVHYLSRELMNFFGIMPVVKICDDIEQALKLLAQPQTP